MDRNRFFLLGALFVTVGVLAIASKTTPLNIVFPIIGVAFIARGACTKPGPGTSA